MIDSPLYSVICFVVLKLPDVFGKFGAVGVLVVLKLQFMLSINRCLNVPSVTPM